MNDPLRSWRLPATSLRTRLSRMRGTALEWRTPNSVESTQAGNVCDTAIEAAFLNKAREEDIFAEWFMLRFRGGA
jgi:hypothetical protein